MAFLQSNIPYFKCWVRKEYTHNHSKYHGEFIHAMAVAVTTMPCRSLSFQMIFTGIEAEGEEDGGLERRRERFRVAAARAQPAAALHRGELL